jgi:hypothetical protein
MWRRPPNLLLLERHPSTSPLPVPVHRATYQRDFSHSACVLAVALASCDDRLGCPQLGGRADIHGPPWPFVLASQQATSTPDLPDVGLRAGFGPVASFPFYILKNV